ncbi:related to GYP1-GTPase activating protein [Serendipita indica DSM 11827]|uniref:Related to GYP1-GTPase activating protein n=1 Tax=Serendipita indica (strain DSM 11827) TaxID=1109443 RepID=G4TNW8_SERID|nr:related to GYP1-GTPase activating protein [Serendipita indica DSM 11827]
MAHTASEWTLASDDAWDSASDSESAYRSPPTTSKPTTFTSLSSSTSSTRPIPVTPSTATSISGKSPQTTRQSTNGDGLTGSEGYTHVLAPSPSSSYSQGILGKPPSAAGWTMVRSPRSSRMRDQGADPEVENEVEVDMEGSVTEVAMGRNRRIREGREAIKYDVEDIVNDPLHAVHSLSSTEYEERVASGIGHPELQHQHAMKAQKRQKFVDCLTAENVDIAALRKLAWSGIPDELRPISWMLLLGYLPLSAATRKSVLSRKREEYANLVQLTFARGIEGLDQQIWHQIEIDVPRTRPGVRLWMERGTQRSLERILYVWAIRHPTSGYVQGINDLVTPFFQVFLGGYIDSEPSLFDPALLSPTALNALEADCFWCLSKLLDGIQDNYISGQPGIHRSVRYLAGLVGRVDAPLAKHLKAQSVEFMQFAFRWMNCLLMRELSVKNTIRMWDTYLSEGSNAFSEFHIYVCCAFLTSWSEKLRAMDFQGIIMFLQSLPTQTWGDHEIEVLLAEAYVLSSVWHNAQSHILKGE